MQIFSRVVMLLSVTMMVNMMAPAFAEAPVYDADSLPQQFDPSSDQSADPDQQDLPPPPPPAQQGAYVPRQEPIASSDSSASMSVEQRMRRVEQQMNNMQSTDLVSRMDALQDQIQALRGQVEQLTHQLQQVQSQPKVAANDATAAKALPVDAKPPLRKVAAKQVAKATPSASDANTNASSAAAGSGGQPNVAEEQQIYQTAYNLIKAKKYDDAVSTLQGMLKKYPSGQFASNAHYWLGELYGLMNKNDQALTEFTTVLKNYPDSPRLSDAQLKVGLIYASQSKWSDAKGAFKKVINLYPGTASARLAAEHLKQIKQAGN